MISLIIIGALVVTLLSIIVLARSRGKKWALALWLPAVVLPVYLTSSLIGVLPGPMRGAGPDVGAVGMAAGFYLMGILPILAVLGVVWITALISWPRAAAWNPVGGVVGVIVCILCFSGWHFYRNETISVVVLDEADRPVAAQSVVWSSSSFGSGRNLGSSVSDQHGIARISAPRGQYWSARTISSDGTVCIAGRGKIDRPLADHADYLVGSYHWQNPAWTVWFGSGLGFYCPPNELNPLPLRLRSKDTIFSPWVLSVIRKELDAQMNGQRKGRLWIEEYARSPEVYILLPDLIRVAKVGILDEDEAVQLLMGMAYRLNAAHSIALKYPKLVASEDKFHFEMLHQWVDPEKRLTSDQAVANAIRERVEELTHDFIDTTEPYWMKHGPVGVHELQFILARPYLQRLLAVMEKIPDNRAYPAFADCIIRGSPSVEQVRPFFRSENRGVAIAAILSVKAKLAPGELGALLALYSHPAERDWIQNEINEALSGKAGGF